MKRRWEGWESNKNHKLQAYDYFKQKMYKDPAWKVIEGAEGATKEKKKSRIWVSFYEVFFIVKQNTTTCSTKCIFFSFHKN